MSDEIVKRDGLSAMQALRALRTTDVDDWLAIGKTAIKDGKSGLAARGLSLIQRWDEGRFWDAFLDEVQAMLDAGRIREDLDDTDAGASSMREFFELIEGKPDQERFRAFCALFMSANAPGADANEEFLDLELMGILRKLSAGEMRVLSAFLKVRTYTPGQRYNVTDSLGHEMGGPPATLIRRNAAVLVSHGLVHEKWHDTTGSPANSKPLLTDLGLALFNRIDKYNEFKKDDAATVSA